MANWVVIAEAIGHTSYTHEHVAWLVRTGKVKGRKSGTIWLVDLDELTAYEERMKTLGPQKHTPSRNDSA